MFIRWIVDFFCIVAGFFLKCKDILLQQGHQLPGVAGLVPGQVPAQGVVTSASSGGVSASFGVVVPGQAGADDLTTTTWGRTALELLRSWDPSFRAGP